MEWLTNFFIEIFEKKYEAEKGFPKSFEWKDTIKKGAQVGKI